MNDDPRWDWIAAFTRALDADPALVAYVDDTARDLAVRALPLAPFLDHVIEKVTERA